MINTLVRRTVRSLAVRIMARPVLARSARRLIAFAPGLDQRLRRMLGGAPTPTPPTAATSSVPPEVARVLQDLRHAMDKREPGRKSA